MSRVFAVWRLTGDALVAAEWPPHPTTGEAPKIDDDQAQEFIALQHSLDDSEASIEWARVGGAARRDERFTMNLYVRTSVPGRSRTQVLDRLEEIHDVLVGLFSDGEGGWSAPWAAEPWAERLGGVSSVSARVVAAGHEGFAGEAVVSVRVAVR